MKRWLSRARSAVSGQFVKFSNAVTNPRETIVEAPRCGQEPLAMDDRPDWLARLKVAQVKAIDASSALPVHEITAAVSVIDLERAICELEYHYGGWGRY